MEAKIRERLTHFRVGDSLGKVYWGVQSIFCVIYVYIYIYMSVCLSYAKLCRRMTWPRYIHAQSQFWMIETCDTHVIHFDYMLEQL